MGAGKDKQTYLLIQNSVRSDLCTRSIPGLGPSSNSERATRHASFCTASSGEMTQLRKDSRSALASSGSSLSSINSDAGDASRNSSTLYSIKAGESASGAFCVVAMGVDMAD